MPTPDIGDVIIPIEPVMNTETFSTAVTTAVTVVTNAMDKVLSLVASNVYLQVGFGVTILGLGIAIIRKLRKF